MSSNLPPTPKLPPRSQQHQKRTRARKTSSVYPPTPRTSDFAHNFPFPPPPIPDEYVLDERGRFASFDNGGSHIGGMKPQDSEVSPGSWRDTKFYDYWEEILGADVKRRTGEAQ